MIHYLFALLSLFFQAVMKDGLAEHTEVTRVTKEEPAEFLKNADHIRIGSIFAGKPASSLAKGIHRKATIPGQ